MQTTTGNSSNYYPNNQAVKRKNDRKLVDGIRNPAGEIRACHGKSLASGIHAKAKEEEMIVTVYLDTKRLFINRD